MALHQCLFFYVGGILLLCKPINDGVTSYKCLASPQSIVHSKVDAYNYHCHHIHNM
jgi:hypothetical protein